MVELLSWGRYPRQPQHPHAVFWADEISHVLGKIVETNKTSLIYGMGRSYGDSCLAVSNQVVTTQGMDRILAADWETGVIFAQAGLSFAELIQITLPRGWFLPVTPGTKYVSLGGAVANDVHGKNHHVMGTFGRHILRLFLYRSDEGIVECSRHIRSDLFVATIGGLGLSGVIVAVEFQLRPIETSRINQTSIRFGGLTEFFQLTASHDHTHEYTVAWIDCLATGQNAGRGHYIMGNHAKADIAHTHTQLTLAPHKRMKIPFDPPFSLINTLSLRAFNTLYYHKQQQKQISRCVSYDPFFYPLDSLKHWNRIYGHAGFQQYQCVIPQRDGQTAIADIMQEIAKSGSGSFLAVLKQCGDIISPGLLSFPMHGVSLALDFPQHDQKNTQLFNRLDRLVHEVGGRLYPAKDAHMSAEHFQQAYPQWQQIEAMRDPRLFSKFWQRVTQ
ncbi:FAD-binding oxidoreductase [Aquirhabdus parva]|uniref:FAD-binding oxidoreductase n=1 Tax=Aquirhabdus parva TaxID=2283318 RepID=A0A345PAG5_9GAMM|nr:FAD-binding oxidoreductase [Aquirhabdus parva]AXI04274.1 FAD-binding oxidoreductase [Aquirhabdus parva]